MKSVTEMSFNPCFNGTMYKNPIYWASLGILNGCFNPCFNGTMYKNRNSHILQDIFITSFNPCFNGTMYKNYLSRRQWVRQSVVSILVLMELCIKTWADKVVRKKPRVSILVLMELCIKTYIKLLNQCM